MGVFHVIDEVSAAITANLATHISAVATAESKTLDNGFALYKRERAETFFRKDEDA